MGQKVRPISWKVYINGKDIGIVETNYKYAIQYWTLQSKYIKGKVELRGF